MPFPVRRAVEPHVLAPVAVRVLRHLQEMKHAPGVVKRAGRNEAAGRLDEVARPHEVIAAEVVVALLESPRDREAGDQAAAEVFRLVHSENGGAEINQAFGAGRRRRRWWRARSAASRRCHFVQPSNICPRRRQIPREGWPWRAARLPPASPPNASAITNSENGPDTSISPVSATFPFSARS